MNFKTKANNMFKIIGRYNCDTFEIIDSVDCLDEAYRLCHEYELSFGNRWEMRVLEE